MDNNQVNPENRVDTLPQYPAPKDPGLDAPANWDTDPWPTSQELANKVKGSTASLAPSSVNPEQTLMPHGKKNAEYAGSGVATDSKPRQYIPTKVDKTVISESSQGHIL